MSKRIGKFAGVSKREQALSLIDGGSITGTLASTGAATFSSTVTVTTGLQNAAVARTATADGTGTGLIADGTSFVSLTVTNANHWVTLPTPTPGNVVWISELGTTGFEVRTSAPATVGINGGTASNAESAIAGTAVLVRFVCVSATNWVGTQWIKDGTESKVTAAA